MLEALEHDLDGVFWEKYGTLPNVIRVAAKAALLTVGKYYALTDDCELYRIAIGMSFLVFVLPELIISQSCVLIRK